MWCSRRKAPLEKGIKAKRNKNPPQIDEIGHFGNTLNNQVDQVLLLWIAIVPYKSHLLNKLRLKLSRNTVIIQHKTVDTVLSANL